VYLHLRNGVIRMINTSSMTLEDILKIYKYMQKSKTHDSRSSNEDTRRNGLNWVLESSTRHVRWIVTVSTSQQCVLTRRQL
jgi:hypothetical protein